MKKTILIGVAFTACIMACKKSDDNSNSAIIGKWNWILEIDKYVGAPASGWDSLKYAGLGGYIDFKTDAKVYFKNIDFNGTGGYTYYFDTASYQVLNDKLITSKNGLNDTTQILTLSSTNLALYRKVTNVSRPYENWYYLSK